MVWERPVTCKCNRSPSWPLFQLLDCFQELQNLWETVTFRCNRSLANLKKLQVFSRFRRPLACEYTHRHNYKQISLKNVWWRRPVTLRCNRSPETAKSQKTQAFLTVWERPVTFKCNRSPSWLMFQLLDRFLDLQKLWKMVTFRFNRSRNYLKKQQAFWGFGDRLPANSHIDTITNR